MSESDKGPQQQQEQNNNMWNVTFVEDPLSSHHHNNNNNNNNNNNFSQKKHVQSSVVIATIAIANLLENNETLISDFNQGGRDARVALADFCGRRLTEQQQQQQLVLDDQQKNNKIILSLETLDQALSKSRRRKSNRRNKNSYPPYVLERSDIWCSEQHLHLVLRLMIVQQTSSVTSFDDPMSVDNHDEKKTEEGPMEMAVKSLLTKILIRPPNDDDNDDDSSFCSQVMAQVSIVALQQKIRSLLASSKDLNAVAFVADQSILPRKSGTSDAPMSSPPAVPFRAPDDSIMSQTITIDMGALYPYLDKKNNHYFINDKEGKSSSSPTAVTLRGLVIPKGITLICGGGYHGKSTLLSTIAVGIYNKIPGDGREFCVSVPDAVTVRAEDGRYVNNCNISAFISNLPTPPGVTKALDTQHFSSRDSSGSTSQAANVSEAIEMGATAMLVDEDVSAANFMARDGRMRALVMDESITPLLYRVNGLYNSHGISSVVVVGGVGDWLDVPHNVLLLDKYVASDATKKAQSISYQFSYGHVQYGGRGVVHRLEWEKTGTPIPRRPSDSFASRFSKDLVISMLDGGHALALHQDESGMDEDDDDNNMAVVVDDDDEGNIEASRLEQLLGRKQLYGCGICVAWVLQSAPRFPNLGIPALLQKLDDVLDQGGMIQVLKEINVNSSNNNNNDGHIRMAPYDDDTWKHMVEAVGFAQRPRKYEVGQALTRMHGMELEELPIEEDGEDEAARLEEERKKKALADLWEARRKKQEAR